MLVSWATIEYKFVSPKSYNILKFVVEMWVRRIKNGVIDRINCKIHWS